MGFLTRTLSDSRNETSIKPFSCNVVMNLATKFVVGINFEKQGDDRNYD